jgi:hypothetical protein
MAGIDAYTKLMLHCTGADASTAFPDSSASAHTVTAQGDMQVDTGVADPWGGNDGVATLDGSDYGDTPDSADWYVAGLNFCMDGQFKTSNATGVIMAQCNGAGATTSRSVELRLVAGKMYGTLASGSTMYDAVSNSTVNDNAWHHVAFVRLGNTLYLFIDGVLQTATVDVTGITANNSSAKMAIGRMGEYTGASYYFIGQLAELRFSLDTGRINKYGDPIYIASGNPADGFTPPTGRYTVPVPVISRQADRANVRALVASQQADRADVLRAIITSQQADRIDVRALVASQQADRADIRGGVTGQQVDRAGIRAYVQSQQADRANIFAYVRSQQADRAHVFLTEGYDLYEGGSLLGKIDEEGYLDVSLAEGTHEIEIRPRRWFWDCRMAQFLTVAVSTGGAVVSVIPAVTDLSLSYTRTGKTKISFLCPAGIGASSITGFAIWYGATSPVDTSGDPAETMMLNGMPAVGRRAFFRTQTGEEYAAIRATDGTVYSPAAEILLPDIGLAPTSPERQFARES